VVSHSSLTREVAGSTPAFSSDFSSLGRASVLETESNGFDSHKSLSLKRKTYAVPAPPVLSRVARSQTKGKPKVKPQASSLLFGTRNAPSSRTFAQAAFYPANTRQEAHLRPEILETKLAKPTVGARRASPLLAKAIRISARPTKRANTILPK
jgi:hypothetical protein